MIATLNGMLDELDCMKRIIEIKSTLIAFPGKIISTKEIVDMVTEELEELYKN